jgi:hypothetical protein
MLVDGNRVGLSPDARTAVFQVNPDRFLYRTGSAQEGNPGRPAHRSIGAQAGT